MRDRLGEYRLFWRQFRENFQSTGAVLPSGRLLATALAHYARQPGPPRRILEAGPGTGAVTEQLVRHLRPTDHLDLVELNPAFVARLEHRLAHEPRFAHARERTRVIHQPVQELSGIGQYDVVVSGLPLNNFPVALVEEILQAFSRLLKPRGVLSFFEYIGVRRAKAVLVGHDERRRLNAIDATLRRLLGGHEIRRQAIWPNVPPAWVHHVQFDHPGA